MAETFVVDAAAYAVWTSRVISLCGILFSHNESSSEPFVSSTAVPAGYVAWVELEAEFTSEPFQGEGEPPAHALKARDAAGKAGLTTDFGPLGTTVRGDADLLLDALTGIARAAMDGGATRLTLQVRRVNDPVATSIELNSALDRLIGEVEREVGGKLAGLDRAGKQRAVRILKERGAFTQKKSVATIAAALGVTRFTVYNYLNRDTG
jgi:uncharacterized protein YqgV (UPF0045/DUF77 family)